MVWNAREAIFHFKHEPKPDPVLEPQPALAGRKVNTESDNFIRIGFLLAASFTRPIISTKGRSMGRNR